MVKPAQSMTIKLVAALLFAISLSLQTVASAASESKRISVDNQVSMMKGQNYAHKHHRYHRHHRRGGYIYFNYRPTYRYYWRSVSYRCYRARCYEKLCLYRRGFIKPIRCKTRRWWRW